jgi:2-dehydropantoate 2-reductase
MQEIHNVAVWGAGAMGAYFAAQFASAPGFSTTLIASGERRERLNRDGLIVNGQQFRIPVVDPAQADSPADLILVALKHHQLQEAAGQIGQLVGETTIFVSVMNGLESEEILAALYGKEKVLYAISLGIDAVREGNAVAYTRAGTHYFGEANNEQISTRVSMMQRAFDRAGIRHQTPVDMTRMLWWKFMINVGVNQASAVMGAPYGVFHSNPHAQSLMEGLMREVVTLAKIQGVNLSEQDIAEWYPVLSRLSPQGKTSMLQDVEAHRKTEVEIFGGKVVALGKTHNIPTPVNETVVQIIRVLEERGS